MAEATDAPVTAQAGTDQPRQGSHIWYELMTTDPEGAKGFYEAVVGWNIGPAHDEIGYRMIGRSDGGNAGGILPLAPDMLAHGAKPAWMAYINVIDVDASVAQAEAKGGRALMPGRDIDHVGRIAMVADPQGNPFYVMNPRPPAGQDKGRSDVFSVDAEQRVNWNELSTPEPVAARQFYGDLFGWGSDEFMDMGEFGEYRFFDHGSTRIGAVCGAMQDGTTGWRYYVGVPSIAKAAEAVKANGGAITVEPHEVPGGDYIIIGRDPQGAEFALVGKQ